MARLDAVMVQQGMVPSRQRAKTLIQNGQISVNGKVCTKPAFAVSETDRIAMEYALIRDSLSSDCSITFIFL